MKPILTFLLVVFTTLTGLAQVVTFDIPFPTPDQEITLIFDATQGSRGLENCGCDVYLHTGVTPVGGNNWQYVQGDWGKAIQRLKMSRVDDNRYEFKLVIRDYYNLPSGLEVEKLSFVFRNADGSRSGRNADGSDIFVDIFDANAPLLTRLTQPYETALIAEPGAEINILGYASKPSTIRLEENGELITQTSAGATQLAFSYSPTAQAGTLAIDFIAREDATGLEDTSSFLLNIIPLPTVLDPPAGTQLGLTREADGSFTCMLEAPGKENVILIESGSNFVPRIEGLMNKSTDGRFFWINYQPDTSQNWFMYQYLVDGTLKVADPFSVTVLDPGHDLFIPSAVNDEFPIYPAEGTGIISFVPVEEEPYDWQMESFTPPAAEDLLIYELHIRDFLATHSFKTLIDTLGYLERLGINAIELMPISEFEGNDSWGYNPSFQMALDKYYGSPHDFKRFVDEAHRRGMAVILDVVLNHVFSQSPLAQLYWDPIQFRPSLENPWLNVVAKHPFNVGYDVNHQSLATKRWVERVNRYWMEEYHIDGYRFDLSKGFTQVNNADDVAGWSRYDASRIALWKEIGAQLWDINPEAILILEHFADNAEERELANEGFLLWGNLNYNYNEGTMGYTTQNKSDLSWGVYQRRNWSQPHLVSYMESHDEERLMFKNRQYGNSAGSYNTRLSGTALDRMELAHTFFWTIPGPKMIWQFGELGYDLSINYCISNGSINEGCRTGRKPIRWYYQNSPDRVDLLNYISDLIWLRRNYPAPFRVANFSYNLSGPVKSLVLNSEDLDVVATGNFSVTTRSVSVTFPAQGTWYDYVGGDSLKVNDVNHTFSLEAGEFGLWLNENIKRPSQKDQVTSTRYLSAELTALKVFPNPVWHDEVLSVNWDMSIDNAVLAVRLTNTMGQTIVHQSIPKGDQQVDMRIPSCSPGLYWVSLYNVSGQLLGSTPIKISK